MGDATGIGWTDKTFNPWVGCANITPGCGHCYAETLAKGRMGLDVWGDSPRRVAAESTWRKPLAWNRQAERDGVRIRVFCASMADVFEERPELEPPRERLFDLIEATPALDWQILTKRPENAQAMLDDYDRSWPLPNVWLGTSIENARYTWRADVLREIPAAVRFISAEPLLGSLYEPEQPLRIPVAASTLDERLKRRRPLDLTGIDWAIIGGESGGRDARPMHPAWARELRDAALAEGVALFFKQWGSWEPARRSSASDLRFPDGTRMEYRGASPKSGGKLLDGREWCEFPDRTAVAA